MSEGVEHIVLTRFNAQAPSLADGAGLDRDWLLHRFALFDRFCFPAMRAQGADATWLVFFDARTPPEFIQRARSYQDSLPSMEVVIIEGILSDARIAHIVAARLPATAVTLCTTRLDNDDVVATDYLAHVQEAARATDRPCFINFPLGYQWYEGGLYWMLELANPFVSFVEKVVPGTAPQTVMCDVRHRDIATVAPVKQVAAPPMWIQVLHGKNLANALRGVRRLRGRTPRRFGDELEATSGGRAGIDRSKQFVWSLIRIGGVLRRHALNRVRVRRNPTA